MGVVALDMVQAAVGLAVLVVAADRMVKSAIRISAALGVSTILIGAVIVGFGTSVPEFLVSGLAALEGNLDLAISNVTSSNTTNVTLVLGIAALVAPVVSRRLVIRREGVVMVSAVALLAIMIVPGELVVVEGLVLLALLVGSTMLMGRWSSGDGAGPSEVSETMVDVPSTSGWRSLVGRELVIGLVALVVTLVAADQLLDGAIGLGAHFGLSAAFLGFMTGVGTSLPELAAAVAAARRRESDLILGNVLGSNIFNSLGVAGLAVTVGPGRLVDVTPAIALMMVGACALAGLFAVTGKRIVRFEGLALLLVFVAYAVAVY